MAFWSNPTSQPKLSFRWFVSFGIGEAVVRTYTVRSFQRPSFTIATTEYVWLNDVQFRPGVLSWNPIEITLEEWSLINPFLEAVNFGQGNYAAEEIITISLTVRYDYAEYVSKSVSPFSFV